MWMYGLDRAGSEKGQVAEACECGTETSGSIKCGEFLTSWKLVSFSRRTVLHAVSKDLGLSRIFFWDGQL
jgi:hypothetical protein